MLHIDGACDHLCFLSTQTDKNGRNSHTHMAPLDLHACLRCLHHQAAELLQEATWTADPAGPLSWGTIPADPGDQAPGRHGPCAGCPQPVSCLCCKMRQIAHIRSINRGVGKSGSPGERNQCINKIVVLFNGIEFHIRHVMIQGNGHWEGATPNHYS